MNITADDLVIDTALVARMLDLPDVDADREERNARRMAWIDTSAGVRFTHGSHRARLRVNRARALIRRAELRGVTAGKAEAARLLTDAGEAADRLGMLALAREASGLLVEC